ncbi:MAG: UrcA family protein [Hyphomonadaceae bacterium]|nr:UrcA family protein [Hyphomonadaceae bacterium]
MRHFVIALVSLCSINLAAATASAQASTTVVRYADLDLNARAGQDALLGRINRAAERVCFDRTGRVSLQEMRMIRSCKVATAQEAMIDVGHDGVSRRFVERGGELPTVIVANR